MTKGEINAAYGTAEVQDAVARSIKNITVSMEGNISTQTILSLESLAQVLEENAQLLRGIIGRAPVLIGRVAGWAQLEDQIKALKKSLWDIEVSEEAEFSKAQDSQG